MAGRRHATPNPAGAHFLRDHALIGRLVAASGAGDGRLVLDLGAGFGAITAPLAGTGARVIAVERDPRLAGRLSRRFASNPRVRVVTADMRLVPLPRRDFLVVASLPFAVTTAMARRLLSDPAVPLAGGELITAWGAARWLADPRPRDEETAWWTARYQIRLVRRIRPESFAPPPGVDAAQLSIRPRPITRSPRQQRVLRALLRDAFRGRDRVARRRLLRAGIAPGIPAARLTAEEWHRLVLALDN